MPNECCRRFPVPTTRFVKIGMSEERHGILYRCKKCGTFIEVIAEERAARFTAVNELQRYYPDVFPVPSGAGPDTGFR